MGDKGTLPFVTSSKYPGVRFRQHPSRKHGAVPDRYFAIRFQVDGRRIEEGLGWSTEGWTEKKALVEMEKLKTAARTGEGPSSLRERRARAKAQREAEEAAVVQAEKDALTFGQFFENSYLPQEKADGKAPRSIIREEQLYRKWIAPVIGARPLKEISPFHLERIKKNVADAGLTPRTGQYVLAITRQTFNAASRTGAFSGESPVTKIKMPSATGNARTRFLTSEEAGRLLEALGESRSPDMHDVALLSLYTGLRSSECFKLRWADVDVEGRIIHVMDPKNKHPRAVPMPSNVSQMFAQRCPTPCDLGELVFPNSKGEVTAFVSNAFRAAVNKLGLNDGITDPRQKVVFHTLRHTCASWMVQNGVPLFTVGKILGHKTMTMTERYSHLAPDTLRAAIDTLENAGAIKSPTVLKFQTK
ncbi:hypothetical protein JCM15519_02830 [Fundidesulfovibrio butyratiphilus]